MNYLKIEHSDVCNGTGLRCSIWLSGCSHRCKNCFNQESWNSDNGILFDELAKQEIFDELSKDYISGVTLTGGDPLYEQNLDAVLSLIKEIRLSFPEKTIWLYTGFKWEDVMWNWQHIPQDTNDSFYNFHNPFYHQMMKRQEIIKLCDVVIDGEYIDEQRDVTLRWRGSSNQRVIDVKQSLAQNKIVLYCD